MPPADPVTARPPAAPDAPPHVAPAGDGAAPETVGHDAAAHRAVGHDGRAAEAPAGLGRRCANCGASAPLDYCPACGQEQRDLHRSLRGVLAEVLDNVAGWDGKILATFRLLLLRPGALTAEFLAGRRVRYLRPLRVFFLASVAFVLALQVDTRTEREWLRVSTDAEGTISINGGNSARVRTDSALRADSVRLAVAKARFDSIAAARAAKLARRDSAGVGERGLGARLERAFEDRMLLLSLRTPDELAAYMRRNFFGNLGTTLFLLAPVFALFVGLLWRRAGLFYAEHAIFALHVHAQAMLALALAHLIPGDAGSFVGVLWPPAYLWLALRRVYGRGRESWGRTSAKGLLLAGAYTLVLAAGILLLIVVALLFGD